MTDPSTPLFADLGLSAPVLTALKRIGYERPTPIQAQSIPPLLEGKDLLGTAQTGTGKTAAFALPLLSTINARKAGPQVLVLAPTRELAIQVAEAFQTYASGIKGFHVLPIYGGQSMGIQLKQLHRGAQVVVGTPGRVMDHLRRGTLKLDQLKTVVLDEADEMLRMGFIDDVEWILEHTPQGRQVALFSATMPTAIRKVADTYLSDPVQIKIESKTSTVERVEQQYCVVSGNAKLDALTRILEVEEYDGIIVFVRTKTSSMELADRLEARGHSASAINGDMTQKLREATIAKLKNGKLDILVATDVAARGIDVTRISHVINYDIPYDTEAYVHRIGRTGRAGRDGKAILFVTHRERRLLGAIERATRQKMTPLELPSAEQINRKRVDQFKANITGALGLGDLGFFEQLIEEYLTETGAETGQVAAALAYLLQKDNPLIVRDAPTRKRRDERPSYRTTAPPMAQPTAGPAAAGSEQGAPTRTFEPRDIRPRQTISRKPEADAPRDSRPARPGIGEVALTTYRLAVGNDHQAKPGDIVGAIANEAGLDSKFIGRIRLFDDYSTVELPADMPREIFQLLQRVRVRNVALGLQRMDSGAPDRPAPVSTAERPAPRKTAKPGKKPGSKVSGKAAKKTSGKPGGKVGKKTSSKTASSKKRRPDTGPKGS